MHYADNVGVLSSCEPPAHLAINSVSTENTAVQIAVRLLHPHQRCLIMNFVMNIEENNSVSTQSPLEPKYTAVLVSYSTEELEHVLPNLYV